MDRVEAVRVALGELGEATSEEVAAFVLARYGVKVDARIVPVIREMVRQEERRAAFYRERAAAASGDQAGS
jgi:hypothetical protein